MSAIVIAIVAAAVVLRVAIYRHRRRSRAGGVETSPAPADAAQHRLRRATDFAARLGVVGLIASREIAERIRGRIFQVGTIVILVVVAAAIVIPNLHHNRSSLTRQTVGVVGTLSPSVKHLIAEAGSANKDAVVFHGVRSVPEAESGLHSGAFTFVIVNAREVLLNEPATLSSSPADPALVRAVAEYLGLLEAYRAAALTPAQAAAVTESRAVPVRTLHSGSTKPVSTAPVIGIVLLFVMLTQYCTWILIGVMQEKSSRVVEVLLATVRPIQLLGGKVLGIGLVALGQATLVVGFAVVLAKAVGSSLLNGSEPLALLAELFWLILGYAFYCWVYAAAGSTAERQDQVQTLALPLSIPILVGYIFSITVLSSGNPDLLYRILAFFPPTAPFCMPVLVALGQTTWWQFFASALVTVVATGGVAVFAARVYRRAVLRTGGRVRLRELLSPSGR